MKPIVFHVEAAGRFRPVELKFATAQEVRCVKAWRNLAPDTDAGEFAAEAAKHWLYYAHEGETAASFEALQADIALNEQSEAAFLMIASAQWTRRYKFLALAYCRRTWCGNLVLDFLAVRPGVAFSGSPIRGLGTGVIFGLATLADHIGMKAIWCEATASSSPFYKKILQVRTLQDFFYVRKSMMRRFRQRYAAKMKQRLPESEWNKHYGHDEDTTKA